MLKRAMPSVQQFSAACVLQRSFWRNQFQHEKARGGKLNADRSTTPEDNKSDVDEPPKAKEQRQSTELWGLFGLPMPGVALHPSGPSEAHTKRDEELVSARNQVMALTKRNKVLQKQNQLLKDVNRSFERELEKAQETQQQLWMRANESEARADSMQRTQSMERMLSHAGKTLTARKQIEGRGTKI